MCLHSRNLLALAVLACTAFVTSTAFAAVPAVSLIEGTLATAGGGPAADGNYGIKISLYKDAVGGVALWGEQATVAVSSGQFQHPLGSVAGLPQAVIQTAAYIGIAVATDPELQRKPLHAVLFAARAGTAEAVACSACISAVHLDAQLAADLKGAVKASELADVAKSGNYSDLNGAPPVSSLAKVSDLKKVALSGSYKDLIDQPIVPAVNTACGTNLVVKGFKADGSLDCTAGGAATLPPDAIGQVTNGVMVNTFVESLAGKKDIGILDYAGPGITDSVNFPNVGLAKKIWVDMVLTNSDTKSIKIELYAPNLATPYLLYNGGKAGASLSMKFNLDTPIESGDLNKDWVGKSVAGTWSITVRDLSDNVDGNVDGKFNWSLNVETLSNNKLSVKGNLYVDGNVIVTGVNQAATTPRYRWAVWANYDYWSGNWFAGNNSAMFGGVAPQTWADGNGLASQMSADKAVLRTLFNKDGRIYPNLMVWAETWFGCGSSTNTKHASALFRIKNNTAADITWKPQWYYTSYSGWSEQASFAFNGNNIWQSSNNCGPQCTATATVTVPAGKTSTAIFVSSSNPCSSSERGLILAFYNGSLALPVGLEFVDDLDIAANGWNN